MSLWFIFFGKPNGLNNFSRRAQKNHLKKTEIHLLQIAVLSASSEQWGARRTDATVFRKGIEREQKKVESKKFCWCLFSVSINKPHERNENLKHMCRFLNDDFWYENCYGRKDRGGEEKENDYDLLPRQMCKSMRLHCPWAVKRQSLSDLNGAIIYIYNPNLSTLARLLPCRPIGFFFTTDFACETNAHPRHSATFQINLA